MADLSPEFAREVLQLILAHLHGAGLVECASVLQRESGVPHQPGRFAPSELARRLAVAALGVAALTPELEILTAGAGDHVALEVFQLTGGHTANITSARWLGGERVISGGADRLLCVSRLDGTRLSSTAMDAAVLSVDVLEGAAGAPQLAAVGCMDGSVRVYAVDAGGALAPLQHWKTHQKYAHSVRWERENRRRLASASFDRTVHVYTAAPDTGWSPRADFAGGEGGAAAPAAERLYFGGVVEAIEWAAGGSVLAASVRGDHQLHLFSQLAADGPLERRLLSLNETEDDVCSFTVLGLASSPDGRWLAAHNDKGAILVLCLQTGRRVRTLYGSPGDDLTSRPVQAWHPGGRYLYASSADTPGRIVVWELASERQARAGPPDRDSPPDPLQGAAHPP